MDIMPTYIILIKLTEKGINNIKDLPRRVQSARRAIEKAGGKWLGWNFTMGQYDAVAKAELPDDYTAAVVLLTAGKQGNIRTTTLKAFNETEMQKIIRKIP
jgi:uncharacterized protein with GYD domain